jgi:hypothetical protein
LLFLHEQLPKKTKKNKQKFNEFERTILQFI